MEEKVVKYIVDWLKNYNEKSKMKGFVIGVSGGIDSAVTSTLCAMTGIPVLCLEMEIYQKKKTNFWCQKSYFLVRKKI